MLIRDATKLLGTERHVDWNNGTSTRPLVAADSRGFTIRDTYTRPWTRTMIRFFATTTWKPATASRAPVKPNDGRTTHDLTPGVLYAPGQGEEHVLITGDAGLRLICVFNPPFVGNENHGITPRAPSGTDPHWSATPPFLDQRCPT